MIYQLSREKPYVFNNLLRDLANLPNKPMTVEIKERKITRSVMQNALMWKWYTVLGDHFGYTKDEMHEELATRFLGIVERKTIGGRLLIEPRSTASLNTKEMTEYLDKIHALALNQEIKLPQPDYFGAET